jgi:hypothetical protein
MYVPTERDGTLADGTGRPERNRIETKRNETNATLNVCTVLYYTCCRSIDRWTRPCLIFATLYRCDVDLAGIQGHTHTLTHSESQLVPRTAEQSISLVCERSMIIIPSGPLNLSGSHNPMCGPACTSLHTSRCVYPSMSISHPHVLHDGTSVYIQHCRIGRQEDVAQMDGETFGQNNVGT